MSLEAYRSLQRIKEGECQNAETARCMWPLSCTGAFLYSTWIHTMLSHRSFTLRITEGRAGLEMDMETVIPASRLEWRYEQATIGLRREGDFELYLTLQGLGE